MNEPYQDLILWSAEKLDQSLKLNIIKPNHVVNSFLNLRLVHYYAGLGQLEHLKVLQKAGANFKFRTRYGSTVKDELLMRWNDTNSNNYLACINWLNSVHPETPPATPSSSPGICSPTPPSSLKMESLSL